MKQNDATLKVLYPFCNAVQTAEIISELDSIHEGCSTCGYGEGATISHEVKCCKCDKVIYRKDGIDI